eukprot:UN28787
MFYWMSTITNVNVFIWLHEYLMKNNRYLTLVTWFILIVIFLCVMLFPITKVQKYLLNQKVTVVRKYFHFFIFTIFLPVILIDPEFLSFTAIVALALFIIAEGARNSSITFLRDAMARTKEFIDHREIGKVVMTPIYLLVGCSFPVWFSSK